VNQPSKNLGKGDRGLRVALFLLLCAAWQLSWGAPRDLPAAPTGNRIAILDSARTKAYFSLHYNTCDLNTADPNAVGPMEYKRYWGGWEEVLKELQAGGAIPGYDSITDDFVTNGLVRSSYKVLILSNSANMSQSMVDAIRQWVGNGGHLLATFGSGYDAAADSTSDALASKSSKNSLEQLWQDSLSKYVTTGTLGMDPPVAGSYPPGSVETMVTQASGPTAYICRFYDPVNGTCPPYYPSLRLVLGYGDLGIMLLGRSQNYPGSYAFFAFANNLSVYDPANIWPDTNYDKPLPAVVASPYKKGWAVYYAYAPEFIVGLEFDAAGHCSTDPNYPGGDTAPWQQDADTTWEHNHWVGRTTELRALMKSSIYFLLTTP